MSYQAEFKDCSCCPCCGHEYPCALSFRAQEEAQAVRSFESMVGQVFEYLTHEGLNVRVRLLRLGRVDSVVRAIITPVAGSGEIGVSPLDLEPLQS